MVIPPLDEVVSSSAGPLGKYVSMNLLKPLADLVEVGSLSASINFGGAGMSCKSVCMNVDFGSVYAPCRLVGS